MEVTSTAPKGTTVEQAAQKISALLNPQPESTESLQEIPTTLTDEAGNTEDSTESTPEVQTFKVKVDGEELDVPLDELLKGYSRTSDYTRKTQKVSEERKAIEAEAERVKVEREQYAQGLALLSSQLQTDEKVDWARLKEEDPVSFAVKKAEAQERKEQLMLVEQERHRVAQLQAQEQQQALHRYVQDEQAKLADVIPEWKDAKIAKTEKEKIANFALSLGYSEADISQIYDHRAVVALRKAALYDEMMSKAKSQVEKTRDSPKTAKPGNLQPQSKQFAQARDVLRQKRDVNSFAAAFKALNIK